MIRLIASCIGLVAIACVSANVEGGGKKSLTPAKFREIVKQGIADEELWASDLVIEELPEDKKIIYYFRYNSASEFGTLELKQAVPRDYRPFLLDWLIDAQATVELLRKRFKDDGMTWKQALAKVEKIIDTQLGTLDLLNKGKIKPKEAIGSFQKKRQEIEQEYEAALRAWAKAKGWKVAAKPPVVYTTGFNVTFKTKPPGASIYYLSVCDYQICKENGTLDNIENWYQIVGESHKMGGNFYFWIRWPDGKLKKTGKVRIVNGDDIEFTPDN